MTTDKKEAQSDEEVKAQAQEEQQETETKADDTNSEDKTEKKTEAKADKKTSKKKKSSKEKVDEKDKQIEELGLKLSETNDKYLRLTAEFDNYRKRTLKEKTDLLKTAGGEVLSDILPIVDDFERALLSMENAEDVSAVKEGVDLIYNKFKEFMKVKGITEIEALNQDFDTDFHEALTKIPAPEENLKGKVVDVIQKGYKIDEKVIRFAKVVIGE